MPSKTKPAPKRRDEIPMTDEQKFLFDLKGWLLIPGVLTAAKCKELREFIHTFKHDREKIPPHDRAPYGGPIAELHDHPAVVGVLRKLLGEDLSDGKAYGFRLDGNYIQYRHKGDKGIEPHGGGPNVNPNFSYQCRNQQMYSALTRVVWELNPVEKGAGGTLLLSGSHKSNFNVPKEHYDRSSWVYETYACPEGSVLFFTENLCHSGAEWKSEHPRIAVFNAYTSHQCQYHKMRWNPEVIARWPEKRRTLARGVWHADFSASPPKINDWYGEDNRAY